jgi:hypothetical protein
MGNNPETVPNEGRKLAIRLPNPLTALDGERITRPEQWALRRAEILDLFADHMYGRTPSRQISIFRKEILNPDTEVFNGNGIRREVRLWLGDENSHSYLDVLLYFPGYQNGPAPFFVGLNFNGNHSVQADPAIHLSESWFADKGVNGGGNKATEAMRGIEASRWPIERILSRGYGVATAYYGDLDPDFDDGFQNGIHPLFYLPGQNHPADHEWGAIGAWAWGLSRIMDYLDEEEMADSSRVAVVGHSRLGKAAMWAGAQDIRFNLTISNNSGCGGASLSRHRFGESVRAINETFPHWFCKNFKQFNDREDDLPVDQHMLVALTAPRPIYIASAQEDQWADPLGEFLSAYHAAPVYRLLGTDGLAADELPELEEPVLSRIGYHIRRGPHDVTNFDWDCFMDFADLHL